MMIHTGEKPFVGLYPGCEKRFSEKGNMKTHYRTHLKKKNEHDLDRDINSGLTLNRCEAFSFIGKKKLKEKTQESGACTNANSSKDFLSLNEHTESHSIANGENCSPIVNNTTSDYLKYVQLSKFIFY